MNQESDHSRAAGFFFHALGISLVLFVLGMFSWKFIAAGATLAILVGLMMIATTIEECDRK